MRLGDAILLTAGSVFILMVRRRGHPSRPSLGEDVANGVSEEAPLLDDAPRRQENHEARCIGLTLRDAAGAAPQDEGR